MKTWIKDRIMTVTLASLPLLAAVASGAPAWYVFEHRR